MLYAWYQKFSPDTLISPSTQKIKLPNPKSNCMERTHMSTRLLKNSLMGKQLNYVQFSKYFFISLRAIQIRANLSL